MPAKLTPKQMKTHTRLREDLPFYAKNFLKIQDKDGALVPFHFKAAQMYIHGCLEKQKQKTGMVRAYVVKARQVRCSSYTQARFFHQSLYTPGRKTFILTHRDDATDNLFNMSKTFLDNLPPPLKPKMDSVTGSKLVFSHGGKYSLGTAASPNVGRSMTVQAFHGSESAFWQYSDEIQTGVLQTIADVPGTEIVFESTANGPRGMFYQGVMDVLSGKDRKFIVIFIPWFWEAIYQTDVPTDYDMTLSEEEEHLKKIYNLTLEQLLWRRDKIVEMRAIWKFKQEYPANVIEAFQSSEEALIDSDHVEIARKCELTDRNASVVMGIDPASSGDRHPFVVRQGRHLIKIYEHDAMDGNRATFLATEYIKKHNVDHVFIDCTKDLSLYDQLRALGYKDMVTKVHFNQKPMDADRFVNKRAEMIYMVKEWIEDNGVNIPDDDTLHAELMCMPHDERTANGKIFFIPKKRIKKDYGMSPDIYDALALTFAYHIRRKLPTGVTRFNKVSASNKKGKSPLSTMNRHRRPEGKKSTKIIKFRSKK
jgi:hypothetical protein